MKNISRGPLGSRSQFKRSSHRRSLGSDNLDATFSALSDPTRRAIIERLSAGEASVTEVARPFRVSLPAISKHLRVLEGSGLLVRRREGRVHRLRLDPTPLKSAEEWANAYRYLWEEQLNALAGYLETKNASEKRRERT